MPDLEPSLLEQKTSLQAFTELGAQERHLGETQAGYRRLASGWLLATLAGTAWASTEPTLPMGLHPLLLVTGIGAAGAAGQVMLWNLDLMVANRLLDAVLIEGLRLEQRHAHLPPFRTNMMALYGGRGILERVAAFYFAAVALCVLVSGLAMTAWTAELRPALVPWVAIAALAVGGLTIASMKAATGHTRQLLGSIARSTRAVNARREKEAASEAVGAG